jgi:hypothetical protein
MKWIIRHGDNYANAIFLRECSNCGCQFEYELGRRRKNPLQ